MTSDNIGQPPKAIRAAKRVLTTAVAAATTSVGVLVATHNVAGAHCSSNGMPYSHYSIRYNSIHSIMNSSRDRTAIYQYTSHDANDVVCYYHTSVAPGDVVEVAQLGGDYEQVSYTVEDQVALAPGEYLFFMYCRPPAEVRHDHDDDLRCLRLTGRGEGLRLPLGLRQVAVSVG